MTLTIINYLLQQNGVLKVEGNLGSARISSCHVGRTDGDKRLMQSSVRRLQNNVYHRSKSHCASVYHKWQKTIGSL